MLSSKRANVAGLALAILSVAATPVVADAQCPVGSTCFFGTDMGGSRAARSGDVLSAAARGDFLDAITGASTVSFESLAVGTSNPTFEFDSGVSATISGGGQVRTSGASTLAKGRYATSPSNFYETRSSAGKTGNVLTFSSTVTAFGFTGVDIGDFGSQLSLRFGLADGTFFDWVLPYVASRGTASSRDGSLLFAGFISQTGFTSVEFRGTNRDDYFAFDDFVVGSAATLAPEPSSYLLLATGLGAIGVVFRRRARV